MATQDGPKFEPYADAGKPTIELQTAPQPTGVDDKTGEITYDREPGEPVRISSYPYTAKSAEEAALLRQHPLLKEVQSKGGDA